MIQLTEQELDVVLNKLFPKHKERNCGLDYEIVDAIEDRRSGAKKMYEYLLNLPQAGEGWISVETPPKESGRYWCYVEEITDLGISHFQWNCCYNKENKDWSDQYLKGSRVTHYTNLLPAPPIDQQKKEEV